MSGSDRDTRFWDRTARTYSTDPIADLGGYENTIARTRHYLRAGDEVLELGCGTGMTALRLAPGVARLVATDSSPAMIAIAAERLPSAMPPPVEFLTMRPEDAPWPDASFDVVLAFNLLHLVADRAALLARVLRLLKPSGLFISKTPCLSEMNPLLRLAVPAMRLIGKAPYVAFFNAAELEGEIARAGLTIEERARHGTRARDTRVFLVARRGAG